MPKLINIIKRICGITMSKTTFFKYLDKYKYIFTEKIDSPVSSEYSNCIWQCWLQGINNAPPIIKICTDSVKQFSDRQIIFLDENNIDRFINIPQFIKQKYKQGKISPAHYSDYIRVCVLSKYGGLWLDSTVLLTGKIPDFIFKQNFFCFKSLSWYKEIIFADSFTNILISKNYISQLLTLLPYKKDTVPSISNWFIYSKPNNILLNYVKLFLEEFWKKENRTKNYFLFHLFIKFAILNNNECAKIWYNMCSISNRDVHLLQSYFYKPFDIKIFEDIKQLSPIHKLTYKYEEVPNDSFLEHIIKNYKGE